VADQPLWRQAFDAAEKAVAPQLEALLRDERFAIVAGLVANAQRDLERRSEQATRRVLHRMNLPAGSDVTRLLQEIGALQREVHQLRRQLEAERGSQADGASSTDRPRRTASPGR
jgi:hypothetical protein